MTEPSNQGVGGSEVQEHLEEGQMDVESGCIADLDTVHGDVGIVTAEGTCGEGWQDACALWADGDSKTKGTDVRCALEQAVLGKMAEVGKLVSETPPVQSEELGKRLRLLKECIDVVNALKDLAF
ncbi:unnamed protein product [Ostreobium quekettii]|uniref:Uncharacterized protein n=1 Tax=Ostreobium quekettii TaxID=121088 RepID=A0A8S1ITM7_9CHLO|nr:unnamed protein product [Ostreobium quekettii]|eukprot:evm.model.scf_1826.1 EVM.evm.TU.scf_1826.1   scf_1826:6111-6993(-)